MRYEVTARRDGRFWYIEIPALDGATQARRLTEVDDMARDYIAGATDTAEHEIELVVKIELPGEVSRYLDHAAELRAQADRAREEASAAVSAAARALKTEGLTVREIGAALGVSYQRAHQLVTA